MFHPETLLQRLWYAGCFPGKSRQPYYSLKAVTKEEEILREMEE